MIVDTPPEIEKMIVEGYRKISPAGKLRIMQDLISTAHLMTMSELKRTYPNLDNRELANRAASRRINAELLNDINNSIDKTVMNQSKFPYIPDAVNTAQIIIRVFDKLGIDYYVGGSMASLIHGKPRLTNDIDIVADIKADHVDILVSSFNHEFYIDEAAIRRAINNQSSFNMIYLPTMFKADIFIYRRDDKWACEQMSKRQLLSMVVDDETTTSYIANAETIILQKLLWYKKGGGVSQKQWEDIVGVLAVQSDNLNRAYLEHWASHLEVTTLLMQAITEASI